MNEDMTKWSTQHAEFYSNDHSVSLSIVTYLNQFKQQEQQQTNPGKKEDGESRIYTPI